LSLVFSVNASLAQRIWNSGGGGTLILDDQRTMYALNCTYIVESEFEGYDDSAFLEVQGDWDLAFLPDALGGDIGIRLDLDPVFFVGDADLDLPEQVAALDLAFNWSTKLDNGFGARIRFRPGVYSDLEEIESDDIYFPVELALVKGFSPSFSVLAGLDLRFGFERVLMPVVGFAWQISDDVRLDAMLPESRLTLGFPDFKIYLGFQWNSMSYTLSDEEHPGRELMTIEDFRFNGGLEIPMADDMAFIIGLGKSYDRVVEFEVHRGQDLEVDVEEGLVVNAGFIGHF